MSWTPVLPHVFLWRDSCNVYAVMGSRGALIINAGTGQWLDHIDELPAKPVALACTHFFRDHSAGALKAAQAGIPVYVPEGEREIFVDPRQHFRQRDTYIIYDNYWDLFAPIEAIPVAGVLQDYATMELAGLTCEVVPLPGVTLTQAGLMVTLDGRRIVFCGEAIHSPGKVARVAPFQYNYNDLGGAVNAWWTARDLRRLQPDVLLPSLGVPMLRQCDDALARLQDALLRLCKDRPLELRQINKAAQPALIQVTRHVWMTTQSESRNFFIVSESGKALVIDYGYHEARGLLAPAYSKPYRRRPLLHSLDALKAETGIDRVDVALISHFHDDHVCGVPLLQRLFGTECWATDAFSHLLSEPDKHNFPCNHPMPMRIDRTIKQDERVQWQEFEFRFAPMNGHTRFSSLIGFEADGVRFAHTGDQYFFQDDALTWITDPLALQDWAGDKRVFCNHVYRNGALLDGYDLSAAWLREWKPAIILSGHQHPFHTDEHFFNLVDEWAREYSESHQQAMPLGHDEAHFNLDSWGGWIWPYRTHLPHPAPATVTVTVRNPLPHEATLDVRLVGPAGWLGSSATMRAAGRAEARCELTITPDAPCFRQPFAVELTVEGQPFGQVAEALMTVDAA
jgi:glyoxylase-like metal-dependent hydrolase (beta-lactamase superfamily II)